MNVLIAEDDENIRSGLAEILRNEGYATILARDGKEALTLFRSRTPDFVCLDIMMPGTNGYDVCREIRKANANVPVIFISAKSEEVDKVLGLELGADDYILKPFGVREVLARIRAVTRRCLAAKHAKAVDSSFYMGDLEVFPAQLRARRDDDQIDLSLREVKILQLLHARKEHVVDRDTFFNECWGLDFMPNSRTLDQHISKLRKRIERDHKNPAIIQTIHGVGYRFDG